jgi:hypothetical protein
MTGASDSYSGRINSATRTFLSTGGRCRAVPALRAQQRLTLLTGGDVPGYTEGIGCLVVVRGAIFQKQALLIFDLFMGLDLGGG